MTRKINEDVKRCAVCDETENLIEHEMKNGRVFLCTRDSLIDDAFNPEHDAKTIAQFRRFYIDYYMLRNVHA